MDTQEKEERNGRKMMTVFMWVFVAAWAITIIGLIFEEKNIAALGAILMIIVGLNAYTNGIPHVIGSQSLNYTNGTVITKELVENKVDLSTQALSMVTLFSGIYFFITLWMRDWDFQGPMEGSLD